MLDGLVDGGPFISSLLFSCPRGQFVCVSVVFFLLLYRYTHELFIDTSGRNITPNKKGRNFFLHIFFFQKKNFKEIVGNQQINELKPVAGPADVELIYDCIYICVLEMLFVSPDTKKKRRKEQPKNLHTTFHDSRTAVT